MKVPHDEGVADHIAPESCGGCSNTVAEALTGESVGGQLSSEITIIRVPTLLLGGEGHIAHSDTSELWGNPAEFENLACVDAFWAKIEISVNLPELRSWNGENPADKNFLVYQMAPFSGTRRRYEARAQTSGGGREGIIPYYCLTKIHGSRTTS